MFSFFRRTCDDAGDLAGWRLKHGRQQIRSVHAVEQAVAGDLAGVINPDRILKNRAGIGGDESVQVGENPIAVNESVT